MQNSDLEDMGLGGLTLSQDKKPPQLQKTGGLRRSTLKKRTKIVQFDQTEIGESSRISGSDILTQEKDKLIGLRGVKIVKHAEKSYISIWDF